MQRVSRKDDVDDRNRTAALSIASHAPILVAQGVRIDQAVPDGGHVITSS